MIGKPIPKITWYHKNEPIKEAKDVTIYQDSEGVCKLAISEVFPEDAGEYTCHAINKVGEAVCAASLIVEGQCLTWHFIKVGCFPSFLSSINLLRILSSTYRRCSVKIYMLLNI